MKSLCRALVLYIAVFCLLLISVPKVESHILVSERIGWIDPPQPATIYKFTASDKKLKEIKKIALADTLFGIKSIEVFPLIRKIVFVLNKGESEGIIHVVDMDNLDVTRTISLPFPPTLGAYYLREKGGGLGFALLSKSEGPKGYDVNYVSSNNELHKVDDIDWGSILIKGRGYFARGSHLLRMKIDKDTGEIYYYTGKKFKSKYGIKLDAKTKFILHEAGKGRNGAYVNDDDHFVFEHYELDKKAARTLLFIYSKKDNSWDNLIFNGVYVKFQKLGDYFVGHEVILNKSGPREFTGTYYLVSNKYEKIEWKAGKLVEILAIKGNKILYRNNDKLYEGLISSSGQIITTNFLLQNSLIEDVHHAIYE